MANARGGEGFIAVSAEARKKFWLDRARTAAISRHTNAFKINEDVSIPLPRMGDYCRRHRAPQHRAVDPQQARPVRGACRIPRRRTAAAISDTGLDKAELIGDRRDQAHRRLPRFAIAGRACSTTSTAPGRLPSCRHAAPLASAAAPATAGCRCVPAPAGRQRSGKLQDRSVLAREAGTEAAAGRNLRRRRLPAGARTHRSDPSRGAQGPLFVAPVHMHAGMATYTNIPVNSDNCAMLQTAYQVERIVALARRHGGVISGEHGIGITKLEFLGEEEIRPFREYKRRIDPEGRFNRGKLMDPGCGDLTNAYTPSFACSASNR